MAYLTVKEAAKAAGMAKQTMYKWIKDGKVSVSHSANGEKKVDTSELIRVFGELKLSDNEENKGSQLSYRIRLEESEKRISLMAKQIEELKEDKKNLMDLLGRETRKTERLLEDKSRQPGILARLLGKPRREAQGA